MMVLVQSSFQTTWASLFEIELEPNLLNWNVNDLELKLELEDMKRTNIFDIQNIVPIVLCCRTKHFRSLVRNLVLCFKLLEELGLRLKF